jgi:hypothetical protein
MTSAAFDTIRVAPIDPYTRTRIERRRLWRKLDAVSAPASEEQLLRYAKLKRTIIGLGDDASQIYFGMNPITLTCENRDLLDPQGFFTPKADGLGGLAVWCSTLGSEKPDAPSDTMLFITRNNQVRSIKNVPLFVDTMVVLDTEMVLCRKKLSSNEHHRLTSGFNVYEEDYLDYYSFLDAEALAAYGAAYDISSDEHQARYDNLYELCCAAYDCIFYKSKCIKLHYRDRITAVNEILETNFVRPTVAGRRRMMAIQKSIDRIGGPENIPLRLFLKPVVPMHCISSGFHALPDSMFGVRVDGVIFMRPNQTYDFAFTPGVLKWKPPHSQTVDFTAVRIRRHHQRSNENMDDDGDGDDERKYVLCIMNAKKELVKVTEHVLDDTHVADDLLRRYANTEKALLPAWKINEEREQLHVLECQPVIAGGRDLHNLSARQALHRKLWWRPIEWRQEKTRPNSRANYEGVCNALLNPLTEADIIALIREKSSGAPIEPIAREQLVPIDLPVAEVADLMD